MLGQQRKMLGFPVWMKHSMSCDGQWCTNYPQPKLMFLCLCSLGHHTIYIGVHVPKSYRRRRRHRRRPGHKEKKEKEKISENYSDKSDVENADETSSSILKPLSKSWFQLPLVTVVCCLLICSWSDRGGGNQVHGSSHLLLQSQSSLNQLLSSGCCGLEKAKVGADISSLCITWVCSWADASQEQAKL